MGIVKKVLPNKLYQVLFDFYQDYIGLKTPVYSQEGEELILRKIFSNHQQGFYIDVGAYHPKTFSNTYFFYKRAWKGINIDANPQSIAKFKRFRKRDININVGISDKNIPLNYYMFEAGAMNTFSEEVYKARIGNKETKFLAKKEIPTKPLQQVLEEYLPKNQIIDFMSIDVEGLEMQVLETNDWQKYRPRVVLVEEYERNLLSLNDSQVYQFFTREGYRFSAKTFSTFVFVDVTQF